MLLSCYAQRRSRFLELSGDFRQGNSCWNRGRSASFFSYIYCQLSGNPTFFVVTEICYFNFGLSNINQVISSETGNNAGCKSLIYFWRKWSLNMSSLTVYKFLLVDFRTHSLKYLAGNFHLSTFKRRTNNSFLACFPFICCQAISTIVHLNF